MNEINLELFFSRIGRIDRRLKTLEKEIPEIDYSSTLVNDDETELELPTKFLIEAEKTTDAFKWLFAFENDLREELREILEENFKVKEWLEKITLDEETKKIINKRITAEQESLSSSRINSDVLDFCTLPEIKEIIVQNWDLFKENYPRGTRFTANIIRDINRYRIIVAHFSELSDADKQILKDRIIRFYNPLSN